MADGSGVAELIEVGHLCDDDRPSKGSVGSRPRIDREVVESLPPDTSKEAGLSLGLAAPPR